MALINGTPSNDRLDGTAGNDEINGFAGDDILNGLNGDDVVFGGDGSDFLVGGAGADRLFGGAGDDVYFVEHAGDVVQEFSNDVLGGDDSVIAEVSHTLGFGIEFLGLAGTAAINGTGNALHNVISGNSANNVLSGLDGNDELRGNDGDDVLNGGTGADFMEGDEGSDTYIVDHVGDIAFEASDDQYSGFDTVQSSVTHTLNFGIEFLTLTSGAAINGTGNESNNILTGNSANNVLSGLDGADDLGGGNGNDQLFGGNGVDTLFGETGNDMLHGGTGDDGLNGGSGNDMLNGGTGADLMQGGDGNDTYIVDQIGDVALESLIDDDVPRGVDHVQATVTYALGFGIERLTLTGSAAINGTGNKTANSMAGNSANNVLSGLDGNDTLAGGAGNDTLNGGSGNDVLTGSSGRDQLNGGAGNDRFDYNAVSESPTSTGRDVITGFAGAGTALGDQIDLRDIDANVLVSGNQAFTWKGATPGGAGTLWYTGGVLHGNVDGDSTPEFQIQLVGTPALSVGGAGTDILL